MAIVIPGTSVNYPVAFLSIGLRGACVPVGQNPVNGPLCIPAEIDWGSMGGTNKIVGFNIGNAGATRSFEDLCAIQVDNSQCGADIEFIFTDTQTTYTVPAYLPYALFPIFTKSLQFYCVSKIDGEIVETTDITRFTMFNFVPPPVVLPTSPEQSAAVALLINATGAGLVNLIPAGINGTVQGMSVFFSGPVAAGGAIQYAIQDGSPTPRIIGGGQISYGAGDVANGICLQLNPCDIRFNAGLNFLQTGANVGGAFSVNVLYRLP